MILNRTFEEKNQESKWIGSTRKQKGLTLFAKDPDKNEVYAVPIEKRVALDVTSKKEVATHKAVVNPNHKTLWALNLKNAKRKLNR